LVAGVIALAGCGGGEKEPSDQKPATVSGDQRSILATIDTLQTASRDGDGEAVCDDVFTRELSKSIEAAAKQSCAKEVRQRLFAPDAEISVSRDIEIAGRRGTATVQEQNGNVSELSFVKQDAQWRIDRVTPQKTG
jgi:hypothetical protein